MMWKFFISIRYLLSKRKEKLISVTTALSVVSVMIGVAALIIVLGVMNGFGNELRQRIVGFNYHIYVEKPSGLEDPDRIMNTIRDERILSAAPFIDGQAIALKEGTTPRGVLIRGIETTPEKTSIDINMLIFIATLNITVVIKCDVLCDCNTSTH